nr:hypothetical protein [Variovorax boronicumulans]
MLRRKILSAVLVLAGCASSSDTANVQILPSQYSVGEVKSAVATPVVDEVVRLKPKKVHISMCRSTPNAKVIQFNAELQARLDAKITGGFYENCPET